MNSISINKLAKRIYWGFYGFLLGGIVHSASIPLYGYVLLGILLILAVLTLIYVYYREKELSR